MEHHWNVGRDPIPQIAIPVCGSSVVAGVMAMISYLRVFGVKGLKQI